ncbi:PEP/pyruvate-binding domain-containing protein, partial [Arthrospira platensis SPKY1]|nr:PEP/pyruvate-binding domain-containing protein [Arthrospira platensis SPKY1]
MSQDIIATTENVMQDGNGQAPDVPKYVYLFTELDVAEATVGDDWDKVRSLLGGKGANLADMTRLGIPVPPGFIVTTEACNAYLKAGAKFPPGVWQQTLEAVQAIEAE